MARRAALSWARRRDPTPQRLWPLLRSRGLEALLEAPEDALAEWLGSRERARALRRSVDDADAEHWAAEIERRGVRVITAFDPEYPRLLLEIADPPFALHASGSLDRLRLPAVSVVGSREATRYGRDVARRLGGELSAAGVAVVSGFARGVDAAAHEAALEGPGGTIAVLGCGIDVDYPREHRRLRERVAAAGGLFLSEHPPGEEPRPQNFPIRNRIIAGLASGVVVVEASRRSGSLITARLAADFGRDVFAVPGSIFSETSSGAHALLRDGAIVCTGVEDVLTELFPAIGGLGGIDRGAVAHGDVAALRSADVAALRELSAEARRLLETIARDEPVSADELSRSLDLPAAAVLAGLFELEGAGLAVAVEGGRYGIRRP
ncbi:MAG TPA: DNA-processing protein DprA [Thermoanaerobaculia bacterium]|nr:DNA-processing protein DprA [Thermoanaerobaculia bacterium]